MFQACRVISAVILAASSLFATSSYAQQDQSLSSVMLMFKDVPGLGSLPATNAKKSGNVTTTEVTLRGTPTAVMNFQVNGVELAAIIPSKFKLTDLVPIPNGTPIDGVSFSNTAYIYLPKGKKQLAATISNFPQALRNAVPQLNGNLTLTEGFNLYSVANFQSSNSIRQVLSAVGHNQFNLPMAGVFPADIFGGDPLKASAQIKDALLKSLKLDLPLPKLTIPGMPNTIVVDNARLAIVGRDVNGKSQVFAGLTGGLDVKVTNTPHRFSFGLLAVNPGKTFEPKITAESKDPVKLPFFQELDLTDMQLVAERKGNAWNTVINATAKLKGKSVAVSVHHDPAIGDTALIKTKMTLADVLPSGTSVPGLTDVEFDTIEVAKGLVQATGKIKDMDVVIAGFKHNGKTLIAVATPKPIHISSLIPGIGKTPLDDVAFAGMSYLWVPKGGAITGMKVSDLPPSIAAIVGQSGTVITAKEGVNVVGRMEIAQNGELGKLLTMAGLYKNSIPLAGGLSPAVFQKSNTTQIKNQILDNLDLNIPLPKINIPGISDVAKVQHTSLSIKGLNVNGVRSIDVAVGGELDINATGSTLKLNYNAVVHKQSGQPDTLALSAIQPKDQIATIKLLETFKVSEMVFHLTKTNGKYETRILGTTTFRGKPVQVAVSPNLNPHIYLAAKDLLLKDVMGTPMGVPEIDNIKFSGLGISSHNMSISIEMLGQKFYGSLVKVPGQSKPFIFLIPAVAKLPVTTIIPGSDKTPLKDADFEGLAFAYNPTQITGPINTFPQILRPYARGVTQLKPGMNIHGSLVVHPSGEMAKLLKMAGINQARIPLSGGFSSKVFSKDTGTQAIKNAIIDSLDLNIPLPKLNVPGIPPIVSVQHTALIIKGQNDKGTRSVDVALGGELDFNAIGSKIQLNYEAAVHKEAGQPDSLSLSAKQPKDQTATLKLLETFKISELDFELTKKKGKYDALLLGSTTFRGKSVRVGFRQSPNPSLWISANNLLLKDVMGTSIGVPEIDNIKFSGLGVGTEHLGMVLEMRGQKFYGALVKVPGQARPFLTLSSVVTKLPVSKIIPGTDKSPLKDADFEGLAFVYNPTQKTGPLNAFPASLKHFARGITNLKPGMNIHGSLVVHPSGEMAALLKDFGVSSLKLPLTGGFSPKALASNFNTQEITNAILDGMDIELDLPVPHIAAMSQFLSFKNGHMGIKGKLPDGKRGIAFQVSGDAELKVANEDIAFYVEVDAARSQDGTETDFEVKGHTDKPWVHPMGIEFMTLEELVLDIQKQKTGSTNTYDVSLSAKSDIGSHSKLDVLVDVHEEGNKLTDVYFELDGPLKLSDMPGLNQIPHADKFALTKLIVSEHGIEADTILGGRATDLFAFHGSGWNVALTQKDFAITELLPPLKKTPLNEIKFPYLALMLSEKGLNKQFSQLSKVGQDALKDIFTSPNDTVKIDKGLAIIAGFHPDNTGGLKKGVQGIGVHDGMVVIGEIDGIFGGSPLVKLEGKLSHTGTAAHMPNGTSYQTGEEIAFFINALESGQDFDFELGIEVGVHANISGDNLLFDSRVKMEVMEEGFGIDVEGQMKGTWHKPFGINGFSLSDVTIELGTQEDGAIKLGFGGATVIADQHFKMAADGKFLPEALGFPQAIAFVGSADTLPLLFIEDIALQVLAKEIKFDLPPSVLPEFKDVKFAFATPGAEDPDLKINGEGFAMKGGLEWLGHELGDVNVSVSPTTGIYAEEKIADINLGPLKMTDNHFLMKAGLKNIVPTVSINADIEIAYLDIKDKFDVTFDKKGASFETSVDFGKDFSMHNLLRLSGVDLSLTKPSFTNADFYMEGDLKLDIGKFVEEPAKLALDTVFNELEAGFKKAEADIKAARANVADLTGQINAERAKVRKERAAAERVLQGAEDRVNSLNSEIDKDWDHYHGCSGWFSWACEARWGIEIGFLKGARDVADAALELAKTTVDHFPLDLDPRIAPLIVARDGASAVLTAALDAFEGADFFDKVLKEVTDKVVELVGKSVNIHKAGFEGDLKGLIDGTQPLAVTLDAEIFGTQIEQIIPFNPKNIAYDVEQMSFLGLRALHHIVGDVLKDIPAPIKNKILGYTLSQIGIQQDAAKKELAKYGKAFAGYEAQEVALQKVIATLDKAYAQQKYAETHNPMDHYVSESFANDFIEIAHTALCLDNVGGLIKQDRCKDDASTRWSTKPIDGAPNVPANAGYVNITDAKTGECVVPEGKWADVEKKFTGPGLPADKSFSYKVNTFVGDGKITVAACENKREYYWKILKHGEGWMQMANRATSKCLHFEEGSSLPGQATAKWASCIGSANQVYRVADKTTPEYYQSNIALKNDSQSACFSDPGTDGKITMVDCTKGAKYNYVIDIRGYIKFINTKTGQCIQPETYHDGAHLIEKPCTQLDYQWWSPITVPGGWRIQNAQTNTCTRAPGLGEVAVTETCKDWAQSIIAPVTDPYSGITYTNEKAGYLEPVVSNTSGVGICNVQVPDAGNTRVTGFINTDGKCYFYHNGDQTQPAGGDNFIVTVLDGIVWQAHYVRNKLPEYAIPSGYIDDGTNSKTTYICRFRSTQGRTVFGWIEQTQDVNYCNYNKSLYQPHFYGDFPRPSVNFEVLVRRADKAYLFHLGDLKPGGSKAGKDPVIQALASQKGYYDNQPVSDNGVSENGVPLNGWKPDTAAQYGGPELSKVGDVVTIKGRVSGGKLNKDGIWQIPKSLVPPETQLFYVNSNQGLLAIEVHSDGKIIPSGASANNVGWIDFSGIVYGTTSASLPLEHGWEIDKQHGYGKPVMVKVGNRVIVNGVAAKPNWYPNRGHVYDNQFDLRNAITHLPQGFRPQNQTQYEVPMNDERGRTFKGNVTVYPDGRILPHEGASLVSLSGISFDATSNIFNRADYYGPLLNGWGSLPTKEEYSFSVSGDVVTLNGTIARGQAHDKIWQLPAHVAPSKMVVFNKVKNDDQDAVQLVIHPDGMVSAPTLDREIHWISLSGLSYSRKGGAALSHE